MRWWFRSQQFAQGQDGAVLGGTNGGIGDVQHLGDLGVGEPGKAQFNDCRLSFWELCQHGAEMGACFGRDREFFRGRVIIGYQMSEDRLVAVCHWLVEREMGTRSPVAIDHDVASDGEEPAAEGRTRSRGIRFELREGLNRVDEDLRCRVGGVFRSAKPAQAIAVDEREICFVDRSERADRGDWRRLRSDHRRAAWNRRVAPIPRSRVISSAAGVGESRGTPLGCVH